MSMSSTLNAKHGPLKTWQWAGLLGAAVAIGLVLRARSKNAVSTSSQTVDPTTADDPIDPWTGIPYSQEALSGGGTGGVSGSGSVDTTTDGSDTGDTVPVTMDPPDWYTNPPAWFTAPAVSDTPDPGPMVGPIDTVPSGTNSAKATHTAVAPPKATKASVAAAPAGAKSGTPQAPTHVNPANNETYETIVKDHKVYHYYAGRSGPSAYEYIRPASK